VARVVEPDWDDLRTFLGAVRARSLAGAARALGVEHTTVGRRLSALETALGAGLVARGPAGLLLTPLGQKVVPLVEAVERAVGAVRELVASEKTRVRVAVPTGFATLLAPGLAELRARRPEIIVELLSGASPVDLKKGEADLAIRIGPVTDRELIARRLPDNGWSLYASEAYLARRPAPPDLQVLDGHDVIGYGANLVGVPAAQWLEAHTAGATIIVRASVMTEMLGAALSGAGIAALPCRMGDGEATLRRLTSAVIATRPMSLVYRREARLSAAAREVSRFVIDLMRETAPLWSGVGGRFLQSSR
jgi:DNA-binding transcriptional LysR family regulator